MSGYTDVFALKVKKADILDVCRKWIEDSEWIIVHEVDEELIIKEKLRFDWYNPVTLRIRITEKEGHSKVEIVGSNFGFGHLQDDHVKNRVNILKGVIVEGIESVDENDNSISSELMKISELFEKGLLTESEFSQAKKLILKR